MNIVLVPLRGDSKGIPKKNIKLLGGKPLCAWVLEAACASRRIDKVFVSTDSMEISDVVDGLNLGVQIVQRPVEFATDAATTESVMLHFMKIIEFDTLITVQATSPLLKTRHLDMALAEFESRQLDSMLSAVRLKRFLWNDQGKPVNYDPLHRPRRQDFAGTLMENGAFYVTKRKVLEQSHCRLGGKVGIYEMEESTAIEIDEPSDWLIVEEMLKG